MNAKAEKMERMLEEERVKAKEKERQQNLRHGTIFGNDFERYREKDIKNITDVSFLYRLVNAVMPAAQPTTEFEHAELSRFQSVIRTRIEKLKK